MAYVLLRKTRVLAHINKLPRPTLTQDVLLVGTHEECQQKLDEIQLDDENIGNDEIEVELVIAKHQNQKSGTSARPNNGNTRR